MDHSFTHSASHRRHASYLTLSVYLLCSRTLLRSLVTLVQSVTMSTMPLQYLYFLDATFNPLLLHG
jgi:hypothetical protein